MQDPFLEAFTRLDDKRKFIVKNKLVFPGANLAQLASMFTPPVSKQAVWQLMQNEDVKLCMNAIEQDVVSQIKSMYPMAVMVLKKCLASGKEEVAFKAADRILSKIFSECNDLLPNNMTLESLEFVEDWGKDADQVQPEPAPEIIPPGQQE